MAGALWAQWKRRSQRYGNRFPSTRPGIQLRRQREKSQIILLLTLANFLVMPRARVPALPRFIVAALVPRCRIVWQREKSRSSWRSPGRTPSKWPARGFQHSRGASRSCGASIVTHWPAAREVQIVLGFAGAHPLEMPRARVPALPRYIAVAGPVVTHRPAAREVQIILGFTGRTLSKWPARGFQHSVARSCWA
jgi:hypothetical protein